MPTDQQHLNEMAADIARLAELLADVRELLHDVDARLFVMTEELRRQRMSTMHIKTEADGD